MKESFGKFTLGIVTSVSLTAMTFLISKTTPDNKNDYIVPAPPYRRIYFEKGQITTNERVLPAYKEEIKYKIENKTKTVTDDVIKDEIYDSWFYT